MPQNQFSDGSLSCADLGVLTMTSAHFCQFGEISNFLHKAENP